ncbi:MAG: thiamine phosphate synthase [Solirubrobacterales bacterium]|nr:thiamine phosphate synthase [Solirubrobacterales bacterium]
MPPTKTQPALEFFAALTRGEIELALGRVTDDVEFDVSRSRGPWSGIFRGRSELRGVWESLGEGWRSMRWESTGSRPVGGRIAVATRIRAAGAASGIEVEARAGWLISVRDGLVSAGVFFQTYDEALLAGRRRALADARLYLVCEARPGGRDPGPLLDAALRGGVDLVQLRDKELDDEGLVLAARAFRAAADEHGALFFLNDRPDLVAACDADGVHVGQDDMPVPEARRIAGDAALVGLSTHSPLQFNAALAAEGDARADQLSAGPVVETPTKPGRPAAGIELIGHAAAVAPDDAPWFAIGGIDAANVAEVVGAGARRIVVVRGVRDAADPEAAARELRAALG